MTRGRFYAILAALIGLFFVFVELPVVINWARYCYNVYDLGIYAHVMRNLTVHNLSPYISFYDLTFFADHFDPIIIPAAAVAKLMPPSLAGILIEFSCILAAVALIVWFGRRQKYDNALTLSLCALLLFSRGIVSAVSYPVHPSTWSVVAFIGLAIAAALEKPKTIFVLCIALLLFREEHTFVVLAVGVYYLARRKRNLGAAITALGALWFIGVFIIRPKLVGATSNYAQSFLTPWRADPTGTLQSILKSPGTWKAWAELFLPFAPLAAWALLRRQPKLNWTLGVALLPILGIRFVGQRWGFHYGAVVIAGTLGLLITSNANGQWTRVPRTLLALTGLLLFASQLQFLGKNSIKTTFRGGLDQCPASEERIQEIDRAFALVNAKPDTRLYAVSNLATRLLDTRPNVFLLGSPAHKPSEVKEFLILTEGPPTGDTYPTTFDGIENQLADYRAQYRAQPLFIGRTVRLWHFSAH